MYYHVIIDDKSDAWHGEIKTDLTKEQMLSRFVEPYEQGLPLVINGRTIQPDYIERIRIFKSEKVIESYFPAIKAEDRNSSVTVIGGPSYRQTAVIRSQDITDDLIAGPPGFKAQLANSKITKTISAENHKVFIVHGHDDAAKNKVARFVERLRFEAIILHEKASSGRTIIEKIEHYSNVGFAIVLYTPDDVGAVKNSSENLNLRARQNVVFEHGYLIGKLKRKNVVALVDGEIEKPNDISGIVYISIDAADAWQLQLAKEMKQSGYSIDMNDLL